MELEKLQLKSKRDFYNNVVCVFIKYEVTKTDSELCMLPACQNHEALNARLILELKSNSPDFDRLVTMCQIFRELPEVGPKVTKMRRR